MEQAKQLSWFVDCYRMRVDDDYALGGCYLHGLYSQPTSPSKILRDFLVFCKLALARDVVPAGWRWGPCLQQAGEDLGYAFEKSDAQDKWGGEKVFRAAMGGRSLRYTAEIVYGVG